MDVAVNPVEAWLDSRGLEPFAFQRAAWSSYGRGQSGLIHAPTGFGKSYAAWLGPVMDWCETHPRAGWGEDAERLTVVWLTPMRALARDTVQALREPVEAMGLPWTVGLRTGDTSSYMKKKQRDRPPTCLVTTPESLTLLLSYADSRAKMGRVQAVVVDEWHELLSTKRGTQTELALARLRRWNPGLRVWGLSATLGNLEQAKAALLGDQAEDGVLISGASPKTIEVETVLPADMERFPWAGHLGLKLLDQVVASIEEANTSLVFTNTRSQAELWFEALLKARPDWIGRVAIHHGSLDKQVRDEVERLLDAGRLKAVVCTSSLDLGVDFQPVDRVFQVGSPKGVARLMQRAGRSGHQPGAVSRVVGVPAHALEVVEFAAARTAVAARKIEAREPLDRPLDVLVQHLVTCAMGGGFESDALLSEVRTTHAYRGLSEQEWSWCIDFVVRGGQALGQYPQYMRVQPPKGKGGVYKVASPGIARTHRLGIGTITADAAVSIRFQNGRVLGHVEESFVARLSPGMRFIFAGQVLELVRTQGMTAYVRRSKYRRGIVPRWGGGRTPLSTELAETVLDEIEHAAKGETGSAEMRAVRPLLAVQAKWSALPSREHLLIESIRTNEGHAWFVYPVEGRLVHEGLGALLAHRLTKASPRTLTMTHNDYGVELHGPEAIELSEDDWRGLLSTAGLLEDLFACLDSTQLARRQFREVARVAGLILPGFPGERKAAKHVQASSDLFFDVFNDFDPSNLLLDQARREVLERQLEVDRLRRTLERLSGLPLVITRPARLTPLAFPMWAESLRDQTLSSEGWSERLSRMVLSLEEAAERGEGG